MPIHVFCHFSIVFLLLICGFFTYTWSFFSSVIQVFQYILPVVFNSMIFIFFFYKFIY